MRESPKDAAVGKETTTTSEDTCNHSTSKNTTKNDDETNLIAALPKIELHAHLNGCIREQTLLDLAKQSNITLSPHLHPHRGCHSDDIQQLQRMNDHTIQPHGKRRSLNDCFEIFDEIHNCVNDVEALKRITREALEDFESENVVYLELRSTPRCLGLLSNNNANGRRSESGCDKRGYISAILEEFGSFEKKQSTQPQNCNAIDTDGRLPLIPRLLVSIDRSGTVAEAMENVSLATEFFNSSVNQYVVGVDLGGNPLKNDFSDFEPALQMARKAGLKISVHCGELPCAEQPTDPNPTLRKAHLEIKSCLQFIPDRLGHALFLPPFAWDILHRNPIPIECCPTSNVMTLDLVHHQHGDIVQGLQNHHPRLSHWMANNYPISISTDDPGVFRTNSTREWLLVKMAFGLSAQQVGGMVLNTVDHVFDVDLRLTLKNRIIKVLKAQDL